MGYRFDHVLADHGVGGISVSLQDRPEGKRLYDLLRRGGLPPLSGPVKLLVHRGSLVHGNDAFGCWWSVSQSAVWPDGVVVNAPLLDQDLCLA